MLLLDKVPLDVGAINDKDSKQYVFAKEYNDTLTYLRDHYKNGYIRFKRPGAIKYTKGADNNMKEIPKVALPVVPWRIPLAASSVTGNKGKHYWSCCMSTPEPMANGLWNMGPVKSMTVKEDILVNINENPDLAFFLYKISPFVKRKLIKVADPIADDSELGDIERELTERKYAVWNMLADESKLKRMARAYGVAGVDNKQPNAIRKELETILEKNDKLKRQNPAIKGVKEFIEEMKVTDALLLRAFVQKNIDEKRLEYRPDGRWRIGDKIVVQVPANEMSKKNDYLCNYLMAGNNSDKYQEFLKDLINKDYLDTVTDKKEWHWLSKVSGFNPEFKKIEQVKQVVNEFFVPI